jgi:hypothetical protein
MLESIALTEPIDLRPFVEALAMIGRPVFARESRARRKNIDIVSRSSGSRWREHKAMG